MRRTKDILGKAIVSADTGEKLGEAADLLLDPGRRQVVGIVVRHGWLGGERVLPFADIRTLGRDAIIAASKEGVLDRGQWRERGAAADVRRARDLKGKRVMTDGGRSLGAVSDVLVDEDSGAVDGYEIAGRSLMARHSMVTGAGDVVVGPDAIVVPESAATAGGHGEAPNPTDVPPSPHSLPS